MPTFVALLRAVNVGGTGKLPMSELRELCEALGFSKVRTYIQSGNVAFTSTLTATNVQAKLEKALLGKLGKPVGVHLRTPDELEAILKANPFKRAPSNRVIVFFLDRSVAPRELANLKIPGREEVRTQGRELFVHYPDGQGTSKLKVPFADIATGRNLNTVQKLLELSREL